MKRVYDLTGDGWRADFDYVYGPQARREVTFTERAEDGALVNAYCEAINGYDYISALSKERVTLPVTLTLKCRFQNTGAPLIVFSDNITTRPSGAPEYALHFEAVAYAGGCNIWRVVPKAERPEWPVASTKLYALKNPIPEGEMTEITLRIAES